MKSQPMYLLSRLFLCLVVIAVSACSSDKTPQEPVSRPIPATDSTAIRDSIAAVGNQPVNQRPVISYRRIPVEGRKGLDSLQVLWGQDMITTILKLNRKDARHINRHDTLVVPDTLLAWMAYSPFPDQIPELDQVPKFILVNQFIQAIAAYERGTLVYWGPTSTGKKSTPTDNGLVHTNWRSRKRNSTIDGDWVMEWYWNLANFSGVSMHEYELPGYPASHACVRLYVDDAKWFYDWAEAWRLENGKVVAQGTPLVLYGDYPFGSTPPWKFLPEAPDTTLVPKSEIDSVLALYLPTIREEIRVRDSVLAAQPRKDTTAVQ
jgi:hypothetical protein